jgi:protoporphyrinogen oxidase
MNKNKKIVVLGAGPMGLAVAYQLVRDGYTPVIFEADDRLGGINDSCWFRLYRSYNRDDLNVN